MARSFTTGLVKIDGFLIGVVTNIQGMMPKGYPQYAPYPGIGGKFYREGLIKVNEFVTLCGRDRVPMLWIQDTSGIDVGDIAEKAELLGLGQSLIYSIEQANDSPMMTHRSEERHCSGPLHHGRTPGKQQQCLHHRHRHHGNIRHARRDGSCRQLCEKAREGERFRQAACARD